MYDKCYFCLDQLPKLKKESTASFFVNFGRSRGTKEPTYNTVQESSQNKKDCSANESDTPQGNYDIGESGELVLVKPSDIKPKDDQ